VYPVVDREWPVSGGVLELTECIAEEQRYAGRYAGTIQNVFCDFICSEVERIGRDELWACLSFIVVQEGGDMH